MKCHMQRLCDQIHGAVEEVTGMEGGSTFTLGTVHNVVLSRHCDAMMVKGAEKDNVAEAMALRIADEEESQKHIKCKDKRESDALCIFCTKEKKSLQPQPGSKRVALQQHSFGAWTSLLSLWPSVPTKERFLIVPKEPACHPFKWEGWGTSLCWWANFAGGCSPHVSNYLLDLFFDHQQGLGLNIARYNIGGGINPENSENLRPFGDIPGFKSGPTDPYDWSADERQRAILFGAKNRGANVFEAFSNSPPYWMTMSGSVTGNKWWGQDNLNPAYEDAFADYLTEVVKYFYEMWDLCFRSLEPFNEPVEGWWRIDRKKVTRQEGCNFSIASIDRFIPKVKHALVKKNLNTIVSGFDSWSQNTTNVIKGLGEESLLALEQINVHTYVYNARREEDAKRVEVHELVKSFGKGLWMSEYGPLNWKGEELDAALGLGRHIILDINDLQCSAWCYWQALEVPGSLWGLIQAPFSFNIQPDHLSIKKQYYVLMHFSRWIRPGFNILPNDTFHDCLVAATSPSGASLVLVLVNNTSSNLDISYDASNASIWLKGKQLKASIYRTSAEENHVELPNLTFESSIVTIRALTRSITTIILSSAS